MELERVAIGRSRFEIGYDGSMSERAVGEKECVKSLHEILRRIQPVGT